MARVLQRKVHVVYDTKKFKCCPNRLRHSLLRQTVFGQKFNMRLRNLTLLIWLYIWKYCFSSSVCRLLLFLYFLFCCCFCCSDSEDLYWPRWRLFAKQLDYLNFVNMHCSWTTMENQITQSVGAPITLAEISATCLFFNEIWGNISFHFQRFNAKKQKVSLQLIYLKVRCLVLMMYMHNYFLVEFIWRKYYFRLYHMTICISWAKTKSSTLKCSNVCK